MPPRSRKSKFEKKCECFCMIWAILFYLIIFLLDLMVYSNFGVVVGQSPEHPNPHDCKLKGFRLCTTSKGECTQEKQKCVFPKHQQECRYIKHYEKLHKQDKKRIKNKYKKENTALKQIKIRQQYCASQMVLLGHQVGRDLRGACLLLTLTLTFFNFGIFFIEINKFVERNTSE